jgi:NAD(P)H-hydrate epimerase
LLKIRFGSSSMRIVNRDEMKEIDRITIQEFGISDEVLMENAGFEFVSCLVEDEKIEASKKIAVMCGGGNNGGDGFVIARHLKRRGFLVAVFLFVPRGKLTGIARKNYERLAHFDIHIVEVPSEDIFRKTLDRLKTFEIYVDALLGIGFHGEPRGMIKVAIDFLNEGCAPVFSVDIPSGIDANGGQATPFAVKAESTFTVGTLKLGIIDYPGKEFSGKTKVLDIGFPPGALEQVNPSSFFIDLQCVREIYRERRVDSHKGTYGHLAVVGGKRGYEGAALLASRAASRSGCGLVTVLFSEGIPNTKPDEIISGTLPLSEKSDFEGIDLDSVFQRYSAMVVGPGMGVFKSGYERMKSLISLNKKIVIDADGLNNLARNTAILMDCQGDVVLTPHIGEMSRLGSMKKEEIKFDKIKSARNFAVQYGVTLVLKDAVTVVATKEGRTFVNDGGVPSLAKGGSGDVLSGIIGSLMARGLNGHEAAILGVFLHTECGRIAGYRLYEDCVTSSDLIDFLPEAFKKLRRIN